MATKLLTARRFTFVQLESWLFDFPFKSAAQIVLQYTPNASVIGIAVGLTRPSIASASDVAVGAFTFSFLGGLEFRLVWPRRLSLQQEYTQNQAT